MSFSIFEQRGCESSGTSAAPDELCYRKPSICFRSPAAGPRFNLLVSCYGGLRLSCGEQIKWTVATILIFCRHSSHSPALSMARLGDILVRSLARTRFKYCAKGQPD